MKKQNILSGNGIYQELPSFLQTYNIKNPLLVCGNSFNTLPCGNFINSLCQIRFSDFSPNPTYESVCNGITLFQQENCDGLIAIGGGSAIDVAKCIKLFSTLDASLSYLTQKATSNNIPLLVMPTTAGTGSESTPFAVIYKDGEKQSVHHNSIMPEVVFLDPSMLITLPLYQRKCSMLDALCQAIESMWSVNSTAESISLSEKAIPMILENMDSYLENTLIGNENMLLAANLAGQAISITQTTAPHAMSYKLSSLFGISHGHAVALCLPHVWRYMLNHMENCVDVRGDQWLKEILKKLEICMRETSSLNAIAKFESLFVKLNLTKLPPISDTQLDLLVCSVNATRLKNSPISLNKALLYAFYNTLNKL